MKSSKIILSVIVFGISVYVTISNNLYDGAYFKILNAIIALVCSVAIFSHKTLAFSLYKIVHIFILFFFCIAPAVQFNSGLRLFGTAFTEYDYGITSTYILAILFLFNAVYFFQYKKNHRYVIDHAADYSISTKREIVCVLCAILICIYYLYLNSFSLTSILFRGGEDLNRISMSQIVSLFSGSFFRPMSMILFLTVYLSKHRHTISLIVLFICMLLAAPPTGMARFAAASMYLPVSLCLFPALRKKYRFVLLFIFSIVVLFPIMNIFRYYSESISPNIYDMITEQYNTLNFDSYSMFMRVFKDNIITNGEQLLGALLFFVPRSIWPTKPIGSGHYVADIQNLSFANISMPYFGEGYINFGIIGVILFTVLLAYITARVDKWYLQNVANRNHDIRQIPYFMSLGLLFFMLRGDLMSSFAYMCGFLAAYYFIKKVIVRV